MKLDFPKIIRDVSLSEYAPELVQVVKVWVNPPVGTLAALGEGFKKYIDSKGQEGEDDFLSLLSVLLSQGEPPTHWTPDELKQLMTASADTDPAFWYWMQNRILKEIYEHRNGVKKA